MQPATIEALVIVALVLSPGYVFTQTARRAIPHVLEPTDLRFLLTIITAGTAIQALAFPIYSRLLLDYYLDGRLREHQIGAYIWAVITCFVLPFALGALVGRASTWNWVDRKLDPIGLGRIDRMPSARDYVVRGREGRFVRVHLKEGQGVVGGIFGKDSLASLDPNRADLYLEEAGLMDDEGNFLGAIRDSRGVWISHDVMAYVHFLASAEDPNGPTEDDNGYPDEADPLQLRPSAARSSYGA